MRRLLASALLVLLLGSCSKVDKPLASTGATVDVAALQLQAGFGYFGDARYAVVKSDTLGSFYDDFRDELFRRGVVKWNEKFDCNHFASYYVSLAQTRFFIDNRAGSTPAQTLAMGVVWYRPAGGIGGHAVVEVLTDKGIIDIEPQTGKRFVMTPVERESVYLRVY